MPGTILRYSQTEPLEWGPMVGPDLTTPVLGLTFTRLLISQNAGNWIVPAGSVSEVGGGMYKLPPVPSNYSVDGPLLLHAEAPGAIPYDTRFEVVENLY